MFIFIIVYVFLVRFIDIFFCDVVIFRFIFIGIFVDIVRFIRFRGVYCKGINICIIGYIVILF